MRMCVIDNGFWHWLNPTLFTVYMLFYRVRHFPIEVSADGKVHIGKNKFESMPKIIQHYKEFPLFIQEERQIHLGHPYALKRRR